LGVLTDADLAPERLSQRILTALNQPPANHSFNLKGAQQSALKLQHLLNTEKCVEYADKTVQISSHSALKAIGTF
jgi:predicted glycosyltransferase